MHASDAIMRCTQGPRNNGPKCLHLALSCLWFDVSGQVRNSRIIRLDLSLARRARNLFIGHRDLTR
jgi:hypothetical protein